MSMMRQLFRPGAGARHERFIQAIATNTDMYRGDYVVWDTAATPTAITLGGVTLGANDFIFANTKATSIAGEQAGIIVGGDGTTGSIRNTDTTTAVCTATTGSLVIIQTWGVFDTHANTVSAVAASDKVLVVGGTVAGEMTDLTVVGTDSPQSLIALTLSTSATYTRGTVTTNTGVTCFVRCDF